MNKTAFTFADLGYDEYFESERNKLGLLPYSVARVLAEYREAYRVKSRSGEYLARVTGKHIFLAVKREDYPAVGDWVIIDELQNGKAIIHGILPRKTVLKKKYSSKQEDQVIASNIDVAFITESLDRDYNLNRFERFLVITQEGKIKPTIILNKIDLVSESDLNSKIHQLKNRFNNIAIFTTSVPTDIGFKELENYIIPGKTYCFLGSSGVGKSSLINKLLGKEDIKTREISMSVQRGKHTTTSREMYLLEKGGLLIDTTGTREVGIAVSDFGIETIFDEISYLSQHCKFSDCTHTNEPGCAVQEAIAENILDEEKYDNYMKLRKESDFYKMTTLEKREKERKFGKYVKKVLKEIDR